MKKLTFLAFLFCVVCSANSQTDSMLLKNYKQEILENSKLNSDLQTEKQNFASLSEAYKKDTLALQKKIKILQKDIQIERQNVADLDKNKVKAERDNLLTKVDSLNRIISILNGTIFDKVTQIANVKTSGEQKAREEKEKGKAEVWANIVNSYKNKLFDDLIKTSTKGSVARDMQLMSSNPEVMPVLNDLQIYFSAQELLSEKFDAVQIKNVQTRLGQINRQSKLLDALKNDVESYQDFNTDFRETISKLINLDKRKSADGDSVIQKLKFDEIVTILTQYMYDYYDYAKYPYLSGLMLEIIKRKRPNADADITDLLIKL